MIILWTRKGNPSKEERSHTKDERINLNDNNRKEEKNALKEHSDQSIKNVDRNLNE